MRARILSTYPVLTRLLVEEVRRWCDASVEVLVRLWSDWEQIRHELLDADPIAVTRIEAGLGDLHRNGRSVNAITFASGGRVIYKPRSLELDRAFSEMLDAFNALDGCEPLRVARVIERDDYGFVEFITHASCESPADIEAFYTKVGELLALFHLLNATDFHYENIIAHGSTPVPIDLETLMVPCVWTQNSVRRLDRLRSMERSVLRTGMLTPKPYGGAGDVFVDVSALGMTQPQETPYKVIRMANVDTDAMRVERQSVTIQPGSNTPKIGDERFLAADYEARILDGFERIYRLVQTSDAARRALTDFLERGKGSRVRAIMRLTRAYSLLLQDSWHPELLADAVERDIYLDNLFRDSIHSDALTQVACAERQAIMRGDIPFFEADPASRSLFFPSGEELPDFFDFSGVEECERNIDNLGEADLIPSSVDHPGLDGRVAQCAARGDAAGRDAASRPRRAGRGTADCPGDVDPRPLASPDVRGRHARGVVGPAASGREDLADHAGRYRPVQRSRWSGDVLPLSRQTVRQPRVVRSGTPLPLDRV